MNIQWYPGHMAKTRRVITESLRTVDIVCEIVDARIPKSSRNPDLDSIAGAKPRLVVLNRADQADPASTKRWADYYKGKGFSVMSADSKSGAGVNRFVPTVRIALREKLERYEQKGQSGRALRAMIVGIPNVGKSSFINRILKRRSAKTEDRPGVTRGKQWFTVDGGVELLDTPGILWPKFDDEETGLNLAFTGAVRDDILDIEELAAKLFERLSAVAPQALRERYKVELEDINGYEMLSLAARRRGYLISGGEADTERMARILLDEFRGQKLGRITLELPDDD